MSKIDKTKYTKQEYRILKQQQKNLLLNNSSVTNNIVCVKHGPKYDSQYANVLYNMCARHCSLPFNFYCLTDDPRGLNDNIGIKLLPKYLDGWWCKPYMFADELNIDGIILYMDLDVVIANNIDKLFTYKQNEWLIIRDFLRSMRSNYNRYNSSVIRFNSGQLDSMWQDFKINYRTIKRQFRGDQDYIFNWATANLKAEFFPDEWIRSWKWEIRKNREWAPGGAVGSRTFKHIESVVPPKDCSITVFHGDPNPGRCRDPWVVDNWR